MERLTFEGNFCDIAQCRELPCKYDGSRLRELAEADKGGRVVVLPCKVGETVWFKT